MIYSTLCDLGFVLADCSNDVAFHLSFCVQDEGKLLETVVILIDKHTTAGSVISKHPREWSFDEVSLLLDPLVADIKYDRLPTPEPSKDQNIDTLIVPLLDLHKYSGFMQKSIIGNDFASAFIAGQVCRATTCAPPSVLEWRHLPTLLDTLVRRLHDGLFSFHPATASIQTTAPTDWVPTTDGGTVVKRARLCKDDAAGVQNANDNSEDLSTSV